MDKKNILEMMDHMQAMAAEVGLQVETQEEQDGHFIKILLKNKNNTVYSAYEVPTIIGFMHGLQSEYIPQ